MDAKETIRTSGTTKRVFVLGAVCAMACGGAHAFTAIPNSESSFDVLERGAATKGCTSKPLNESQLLVTCPEDRYWFVVHSNAGDAVGMGVGCKHGSEDDCAARAEALFQAGRAR